jgi:hypothetical protein
MYYSIDMTPCYAVEGALPTLLISVQSKPVAAILTQLRAMPMGLKGCGLPSLHRLDGGMRVPIKNHCFASLSLLFADSLSSGSSLM